MAVKRGQGRPTSYRKEFDEQSKLLCLLGATDVQLAEFFHVSEVTINAWKKKHPSFLKSMNEGKDHPDDQVEKSMLHAALGYSCKETKIATHLGEITDTLEVVKQYPPDTRAGKFWLINRRRDKWTDKQQIDLTGKVDIEVVNYGDKKKA